MKPNDVNVKSLELGETVGLGFPHRVSLVIENRREILN